VQSLLPWRECTCGSRRSSASSAWSGSRSETGRRSLNQIIVSQLKSYQWLDRLGGNVVAAVGIVAGLTGCEVVSLGKIYHEVYEGLSFIPVTNLKGLVTSS
jgi:hypothetical protein